MTSHTRDRRRTVQRRGLVLAVACLWLGLAFRRAEAQQSAAAPFLPANESVLRNWSAEFPPADGFIYSQQRGVSMAARAARLLAQQPDAPETFEMLVYMERPADAVDVLRRIVRTRPDQMARSFRLVAERPQIFRGAVRVGEWSPDLTAALREIIADAHTRLSDLSREQAADVALALVSVESPGTREGAGRLRALDAVIQGYLGTPAALVAEVDALVEKGEPLDSFVALHPRTVAAAKALFQQAFRLHIDVSGQPSDPTDRFLRVFDIIRQLESGAYPPCEWVDKARWLGVELFAGKATYAPGNAARLLDAYRQFVRAHFTGPDQDAIQSSLAYVVTTKMAELFRLTGEGAAGVERTLSDLEQVDAGRVRLMRAQIDIKAMTVGPPAARADLFQKAIGTLMSVMASGGGVDARKALATLASLYYSERDYLRARDAYRRYLASYPGTAWAWVAALRVGRCEEHLGDFRAADDSYRAAATQYADVPVARVLGHAYAARASEALTRLDEAVLEYQRALDGWDDGDDFSLWERTTAPGGAPGRDDSEVRRALLPGRIAQLQRSASLAGGLLFERGRWLFENGRPQEAIDTLEQFVGAYPSSPLVADARSIVHRARLEHALDLARVDGPSPDRAAALREIDRLLDEPYDFSVCAATIAKASLMWTGSEPGAAEALMGQALNEWNTRQTPSWRPPLAGGLEQDIIAIRNLLFRPNGDGALAGSQWNGFSWPAAAPRFLVVNPELSVRRADSSASIESVYQAFAGLDNVLFMTTDQIALLNSIITALGGTRTARPTFMQTPNQPIGPSRDILGFWNRFFAARPGHWSGWVFETYPLVTRVSFTNAERTSAVAAVTVGYGGAAFVLEKDQGAWRVREITGQWVE